MGAHNIDTNGSGFTIGLKIDNAIISGVLFGIAGLLVRRVMLMIRADLSFVMNFFSDPLAWIAVLVGLGGFTYMQSALHEKNLSYVVPVVSAYSIITPLIISVVFMSETVQAIRWLGILLILMGIVGMNRKTSKSVLGALFGERIAKSK